MSDWELFEAMNKAEAKYNELQKAFRARGLHKKPFVEYSRAEGLTWCAKCKKFTISFVSGNCAVCNTARN